MNDTHFSDFHETQQDIDWSDLYFVGNDIQVLAGISALSAYSCTRYTVEL